MIRIILFGAGGFLKDRCDKLSDMDDVKIVGISDNNNAIYGETILGFIIRPIYDIKEDYDYIVIASTYEAEIENTLLKMGVKQNTIIRWRQFENIVNKKKYRKILECKKNPKVRSILALTPVLEYNGAFLALVYILMYMIRTYGFNVTIVSPEERDDIKDVFGGRGINLILCPDLLFNATTFDWNKEYDFFIVNTLLMHRCLRNLHCNNTIWWLHESPSYYLSEIKRWDDFSDDVYSHFRTMCVSEESREVFETFFPNSKTEIFTYGLPDFYAGEEIFNRDRVVIAVIGALLERKGQDIFLDAVEDIDSKCRSFCEFWIIGKAYGDEFGDSVCKRAKEIGVKFLGDVSHNELELLFREIDIIVSSSRHDPLPICITEGMMNSKLCIIPDCIGNAKYVKHEESALIYQSGNAKELAQMISYALKNKTEMCEIAKRGRIIYRNYFSEECAGERMNSIIREMCCEKTKCHL